MNILVVGGAADASTRSRGRSLNRRASRRCSWRRETAARRASRTHQLSRHRDRRPGGVCGEGADRADDRRAGGAARRRHRRRFPRRRVAHLRRHEGRRAARELERTTRRPSWRGTAFPVRSPGPSRTPPRPAPTSRSRARPSSSKADGLAAGKGVVIAQSVAEAHAAIDAMIVGHSLGAAGARVVIEAFLEGEEASFIVMADGRHVLPLASSQDHKRLRDRRRGPEYGRNGRLFAGARSSRRRSTRGSCAR